MNSRQADRIKAAATWVTVAAVVTITAALLW